MGEKLSNRVSVFEQSVEKSQQWIAELHEELHWMSADACYHLLRAVLQTLRDQLSVDEAAQFAAQIPLVLRGSFYECWNPQTMAPRTLGKDDFISAVKAKLAPVGNLRYEIDKGVLAALLVIKRHIGRGEMDEVIGALQPTMRSFILGGELESQMRAQ